MRDLCLFPGPTSIWEGWKHPPEQAGGCAEQVVFCFTGTFFAHAALQSLRLYPFTDGWHPFVVAAELIYFLFLLYYMIEQVRGGPVAAWAGMEVV